LQTFKPNEHETTKKKKPYNESESDKTKLSIFCLRIYEKLENWQKSINGEIISHKNATISSILFSLPKALLVPFIKE
jgi:hypothetical protein